MQQQLKQKQPYPKLQLAAAAVVATTTTQAAATTSTPTSATTSNNPRVPFFSVNSSWLDELLSRKWLFRFTLKTGFANFLLFR